MAADLNSGTSHAGLAPGAPTRAMQNANSRNHEGDGQNVLYADGHVEFASSPFVGVGGDNIYAPGSGDNIIAASVNSNDSILLPTAKQEPEKPQPEKK